MSRVEVAKLEAKALSKFAEALGTRLARRVRPNLRCQAGNDARDLRVTFFRQVLVDPDRVACLGCDEIADAFLKLRIDRRSPFGNLPADPNVFLLFCGSSACRARVDVLADAAALISDPLEHLN